MPSNAQVVILTAVPGHPVKGNRLNDALLMLSWVV